MHGFVLGQGLQVTLLPGHHASRCPSCLFHQVKKLDFLILLYALTALFFPAKPQYMSFGVREFLLRHAHHLKTYAQIYAPKHERLISLPRFYLCPGVRQNKVKDLSTFLSDYKRLNILKPVL